jgi:hypothetical protein
LQGTSSLLKKFDLWWSASMLSSPWWLTEVLEINLAVLINLMCNIGSLLQLRVRMVLEHCVDNADDCFMWATGIASTPRKVYGTIFRLGKKKPVCYGSNTCLELWNMSACRKLLLLISPGPLKPTAAFLHHENPPTRICCAYCRSTCCNRAILENLSCLMI